MILTKDTFTLSTSTTSTTTTTLTTIITSNQPAMSEAEKLKGFNLEEIVSRCKQFIAGKWTSCSTDDVAFKVLSTGFGNRLFVLNRKGEEDHPLDLNDPHTVLVRLYGGNILPEDAPIRTITRTDEIVIFYHISHLGMGPKLFGCFDGGRIEQFYSLCDNPTLPQWVANNEMNHSLAKIIARFNLLSFPTPKTPWNVPQMAHDCMDVYVKNQKQLILKHHLGQYYSTCKFVQIDVMKEVDWIKSMVKKVNSRILFCHNDVNRGNVLVLPSSSSPSDQEEVILIDYEFAGFNYRGYELGNWFDMQFFDFGRKEVISGHPYPDEDHVKEMVKVYLSEQENIAKMELNRDHPFPDWDPNGRDSIDHVVMESDLGSAVTRFINVFWSMRDIDTWVKIHSDPEKFAYIFDQFASFYLNRKAYFIQKYPQFND